MSTYSLVTPNERAVIGNTIEKYFTVEVRETDDGKKWFINGVRQATLELHANSRYVFDIDVESTQSDTYFSILKEPGDVITTLYNEDGTVADIVSNREEVEVYADWTLSGQSLLNLQVVYTPEEEGTKAYICENNENMGGIINVLPALPGQHSQSSSISTADITSDNSVPLEPRVTPCEGEISLDDVQDEFGGVYPASLSEYYSAAAGVPSSGPISLSDLRCKSSIVAPTLISPGSIAEEYEDFQTVTVVGASLQDGENVGATLQYNFHLQSRSDSTWIETGWVDVNKFQLDNTFQSIYAQVRAYDSFGDVASASQNTNTATVIPKLQCGQGTLVDINKDAIKIAFARKNKNSNSHTFSGFPTQTDDRLIAACAITSKGQATFRFNGFYMTQYVLGYNPGSGSNITQSMGTDFRKNTGVQPNIELLSAPQGDWMIGVAMYSCTNLGGARVTWFGVPAIGNPLNNNLDNGSTADTIIGSSNNCEGGYTHVQIGAAATFDTQSNNGVPARCDVTAAGVFQILKTESNGKFVMGLKKNNRGPDQPVNWKVDSPYGRCWIWGTSYAIKPS